MLEDLGHSVVQAASGSAALAILRSGESFDLLVTDHAMPEMTGLELSRTVAALNIRLPTLVVSGYADLLGEFDSETTMLRKPFTQRELASAMEALWAPSVSARIIPLRHLP